MSIIEDKLDNFCTHPVPKKEVITEYNRILSKNYDLNDYRISTLGTWLAPIHPIDVEYFIKYACPVLYGVIK